MSDDLIYKIFIELAVLEGKREPDGKWNIYEPAEMSRLLNRSYKMVQRAVQAGTEQS
ncbi:MAG: hypothetical protein AAGD34_14185 [Pseudomonadota bacterium]